jgi:hypothetical protein
MRVGLSCQFNQLDDEGGASGLPFFFVFFLALNGQWHSA